MATAASSIKQGSCRLEAVAVGQSDIHEDDVKVMRPHLLEGLGDLYGTPAKVVQVSDAGDGQPFDAFRVSLER